jgi:hypothetical protein
MNFHKNHESSTSYRNNINLLKKEDFKLNIFESLKGLRDGLMSRMLMKFQNRKESSKFYRTFRGKSKSFKKNKRRGL